jgi:hypothetical protein
LVAEFVGRTPFIAFDHRRSFSHLTRQTAEHNINSMYLGGNFGTFRTNELEAHIISRLPDF